MPPTLFFDAIIALIVAVIPLFFVELWRRWKKIKNKGAYTLVSFGLAIVWLTVVYGSFIEPKILTTRVYPITIGDSGRHLRVAVISDLHLGTYRHADWTSRVVKRANELKPDVVILAGDLVSIEAGMSALAPLRDLQTRYGAYAVLGNHDYHVGGVDVRKAIEGYNVEVLTNESVPLSIDGEIVRLAGLDDLLYGSPDWPATLSARQSGEKTILAVHNPDAASRAEVEGVQLVIAGHTHCGQVRLPFLGPVPNIPTELGRHYDCGVFRFGPTQLFVTPGAGESGARARLFNPPEISILEISL